MLGGVRTMVFFALKAVQKCSWIGASVLSAAVAMTGSNVSADNLTDKEQEQIDSWKKNLKLAQKVCEETPEEAKRAAQYIWPILNNVRLQGLINEMSDAFFAVEDCLNLSYPNDPFKWTPDEGRYLTASQLENLAVEKAAAAQAAEIAAEVKAAKLEAKLKKKGV